MAHIFCLGRDYYCIRPDIAEIADHLRSGTKETFVIAVVIFLLLLQQWPGQSSVGYHAPQNPAEVRPSTVLLLLMILAEDRKHE